MIYVAAAVVYLVGYIVTATICARNWFGRFGAGYEGVAWGMWMALMWPVIAVPYLVWLVVRRV